MKRKVLVTMLCLAISVSVIGCGKENTTEQQEVIATEQTTETQEVATQETETQETADNVEEIKTTLPESVETEYYGTIYPAETARLVEEAYNEWYASIDVEELKKEYGEELFLPYIKNRNDIANALANQQSFFKSKTKHKKELTDIFDYIYKKMEI